MKTACDRLRSVAPTLRFHGADVANHGVERAGEIKHASCVALLGGWMVTIANQAEPKIVLRFL